MSDIDQRLHRIGVFYDGNFFYHVGNYYRYFHARRKRILIPGLHEFIRHQVSELERADVRHCQILDAHFFRGRYWAKEADARQKLYSERVFDDILTAGGVVTHYLPLLQGAEKGIDVWLALEAFELTLYKRFNVLVLIAGDSDFVPLVKKIKSLGVQVMVLGWDYKYIDTWGQERETVTSSYLLDEATYPVRMHQIIDDETRQDQPLIRNLFEEPREEPTIATSPIQKPPETSAPFPEPAKISPTTFIDSSEAMQPSSERFEGEVLTLQQGFGFIKCPSFPNNVFFHWSVLVNKDFDALQKGQRVKFSVQQGDKGPVAKDLEVSE